MNYLLDSLWKYEGCFDNVYNFKRYSFQKNEKSNPSNIKQRLYTMHKDKDSAHKWYSELQLLDIKNGPGSIEYPEKQHHNLLYIPSSLKSN